MSFRKNGESKKIYLCLHSQYYKNINGKQVLILDINLVPEKGTMVLRKIKLC